ncbi:hypothetical protein LTR17_004193 [Elasticomyces elasticus]|nr:hypothetical protein LTR17_004193 [Elasticomyces elasticus]
MGRLTSLALYCFMAIFMLDCALEMGLISSTVYWLHNRAGKDFEFNYNGSTFPLHGKPVGLLADQGHTSNGAAGTGFVAVGLGGIFSLCLRSRNSRKAKQSGFSTFMYNLWLTLAILNVLLCLGAIVYVFYLTNTHDNQHINIALAAGLDNKPYPNFVAYPDLFWTPETWLAAVLNLPLTKAGDRADIFVWYVVQKVWRWNLIPMFILQSIVAVLAVLDWRSHKKQVSSYGDYEMPAKRMST